MSCTRPCADARGVIAQLSNFQYDPRIVESWPAWDRVREEIAPEPPGHVFVTWDVTLFNHTKRFQVLPLAFAVKSAGVIQDEYVRTADGPHLNGGCEHWPPGSPGYEKPRGVGFERRPDGSFIGGVAAGRAVGPICIVGWAVAGHPKGISVIWSPGIGARPRPKGFRTYEIRVT